MSKGIVRLTCKKIPRVNSSLSLKKYFSLLYQTLSFKEFLSFFQIICQRDREKWEKEAITLTTIHKSNN